MKFNSYLIFNSSYSRQYHTYKAVWRGIVYNESLICEREGSIECDNAISMFGDCISKKVVEHVPFSWCQLAAKLQDFPNHRIWPVLAGRQTNRGAGFCLEILVDYIFYRDSRVATWFNKALEKLDN